MCRVSYLDAAMLLLDVLGCVWGCCCGCCGEGAAATTGWWPGRGMRHVLPMLERWASIGMDGCCYACIYLLHTCARCDQAPCARSW